MGYISIVGKKDGTKHILHSDSEWQLKQLRKAELKKLTGQVSFVTPMIKEGKPWNLQMFMHIKKKRDS